MDSLIELIENVDSIPEMENCSKSKSYLRQYVTAANFILAIAMIGMAHGHTAILLQQLSINSASTAEKIRVENGEIFGKAEIIVESEELQSWIAAVLVLFNVPACWILALCSRKIGRKPLLIGSTSLFTIGWFVVTYASDAYGLIVGRSMMSLSTGVLAGLTSVYQGECSSPELRSLLNAMQGLAFSVGILTCHAVGTWFHWRTTAFFCGCVCFMVLGLNLYIPESPIWLLNKGRYLETISSWTFLRGKRDFDELKSMLVHGKLEMISEEQIQRDQRHSGIKKFCTAAFLKPFGIMIALFSVAQLSGAGAVTFYCMKMITDIAGKENVYLPTLILDLIRLLSSIALQFCSRMFSTRALMIFSGFSCSFFLIAVSLTTTFEIWTPMFPLILLFAYEAAVIMGLSVLPWNFLSELFSPIHKDIAVGVTTSYYYVLFFVIVKMNLYMTSIIQMWGMFLMYGTLTLTGSAILYVVLPNTTNKSLKEIEMIFTSGRKKNIVKNKHKTLE